MFLTPQVLQHALRERAITLPQLDRALAALSGPDPAGLIPPPTWEEMAHVAAYMHVQIGGAWIPDLFWRLIEAGHPSARAIWWHELQQVESYERLRVRNPLQVHRQSRVYWQAHTRASWEKEMTIWDIERWL